MSIADILKSLSELAEAVNAKSKELDDLKALYNTKLSAVNEYLKTLPINLGEFTENEFMETIKQPIQCKNCKKPLNGNFIIIPKSTIHIETTHKSSDNKVELRIPPPSVPKAPKHENKSKRTCSYCHKSGHTRSRCFKRLNKEKPVE